MGTFIFFDFIKCWSLSVCVRSGGPGRRWERAGEEDSLVRASGFAHNLFMVKCRRRIVQPPGAPEWFIKDDIHIKITEDENIVDGRSPFGRDRRDGAGPQAGGAHHEAVRTAYGE